MNDIAVLFDFDGTLVDSLGLAFTSVNEVLAKVGAGPLTAERIKSHFGASADKIFLSLLDGDAVRAKAAFEHYLDWHEAIAHTIPLHEGIKNLLDSLWDAGIPLGIVTGRHERDLGIIANPHGLEKFFQVMICDNQIPRSKPAPDGLLWAIERMRLQADRTLYVGDSRGDIAAANAASCISVAALWDGLVVKEELLAEKPRYVAHTPDDVWGIIQGLRNSSARRSDIHVD